MIGRIAAALVGRRLDRRHGGNGVAGAAMGIVAAGALRRMGPLGAVLGGGYLAKQALDRRRAARRSRNDIQGVG